MASSHSVILKGTGAFIHYPLLRTVYCFLHPFSNVQSFVGFFWASCYLKSTLSCLCTPCCKEKQSLPPVKASLRYTRGCLHMLPSQATLLSVTVVCKRIFLNMLCMHGSGLSRSQEAMVSTSALDLQPPSSYMLLCSVVRP